MACSNYWTSPLQVGSHQIAKVFLKKGWEVAFLSDPISLLHPLKGVSQDLQDRFEIYRAGGKRFCDGRLWAYVPGALLTPSNNRGLRGGWLHRNWHRLTLPNAVGQLRANGFFGADLLYIDSIYQPHWHRTLECKKTFLRVPDNHSGFSKFTPAACAAEREIAQNVDLVGYTAPSLREYVEGFSPKRTALIPNGVNFQHFAGTVRAQPADLAKIPRPIAVYVGAIEEWFHFEMLRTASQQLPGMSFVLIGPDKLARERLSNLPNVHILGRRKYDDLPAYLQHCDVGIIPFDVRGHATLIDYVNPLKLYEYLACGLNCVSVRWRALEELKSPAILCDTAEEFVRGLQRVGQNKVERERNVEFARAFDWERQVEKLLSSLQL